MADTEATTNEDTDTFYSDWMRFCDCMIAREQKKKGEGVPLTYKDYQPIDHINFTGTQGIDEFMKKYTPGPKIVDVGAGMGGACRILAEEYGAEPIGIEYTQTFIDLGNRISRDLGMPEYLRWGDATQPLGVENADAVFCYGVLNAMPRDLKVTAVKRMFDAVKQGGLLFMEDLTFAKPLNDFHPDRKACMADNPHLYNTCYTDEFRSHLEDAGFEVLEFQDTSQLWGEGCWAKSNDYYIPVLEGEEGNLERAEVRFLELFSKNKPQIYADLRHMTVEQIRERFPLTCKYVDPAHFVHEVTQDIVMVRYICKKPELSSDATTANEDMDVFYTDWKRFCELMIQREQRKKGEGVPLTWQDYQPIDNINFTGSSGISEFMKKYNPGPVIIDVGAGMGGTCRHFAQEFNATPIGIEYTQSFIDLGNQISRDLGLPEYIRWGDASEPLGIENADAAYSLGVLNALPRELKTTALKRVFDAVKPGGLLFIDDLTFSKPLEEFHPDRKAGMVSNPHLFNTTYTSEFRQHLEDAGWQVLEYKDVSQIWGEGCWAKSNDFYLPILEEGEDSLERAEVRFLELLGKNKPTIYADLRHMTVEEIRERYPLTSKYVDPAHYVHEVAQDIVMVRYICRRPE